MKNIIRVNKTIMIRSYIFILAVASLSFSCEKEKDAENDPNEPVQIELTEKEAQVVESSNSFGLDIFEKIVNDETIETNVFISPTSIALALAMTRNGARGTTEEAMEEALYMSDYSAEEINTTFKDLMNGLINVDPKVIMEIGNSIWYRQEYSIEEDFIDVNEEYYNAEVNGIDFSSSEALDIINGWVADQTHDKITKILNRINPDDLMYLINAIYFKGIWALEFNPESTHEESFYQADGTEVSVKMMNYIKNIGYFENELFQAAELDYGRGNYSMVVLLPREEKTVGNVLEQMTPENWNSWTNSFVTNEVNLTLPKFSFEYEKDLNGILSLMGMDVAFIPGQADFSGILSQGGLYISKVKHKTFVEVNEEGTEAAAVTSVGITFTSAEPMYITMRVNRPFIFAIREKTTNTVVFFGKVAVPEQ